MRRHIRDLKPYRVETSCNGGASAPGRFDYIPSYIL